MTAREPKHSLGFTISSNEAPPDRHTGGTFSESFQPTKAKGHRAGSSGGDVLKA
jgi:hypothetical protein